MSHEKEESSSVEHLSNEQKETYRGLKTRALSAIRQHRGEETTYRELMECLIALEQWLVRTFGEEHMTRLSEDDERGAALLAGSRSGTIQDLLGATLNRMHRLSKGELTPGQIAEVHNILLVHEDAVLVPPGEKEIPMGDGNGEWKERHYSPRLQELIALLAEHEIYTDDLVLVTGTNRSNMMRDESYVLVEIPRLRKQILVCNEIGEATFVSHAILSRATFFKKTKEELIEMNGIERIVYGPKWKEQIEAIIFSGDAESTKKINVRDREELRNEIMLKITAAQWINLSQKDRKAFKCAGKGLIALAGRFGIDGNPLNNTLIHLRLGAAIFGKDDLHIAPHLARAESDAAQQELLGDDLDAWRTEIPKHITSAQWINLSFKDRKAFTCAGKGLYALAHRFAIDGNPIDSTLIHLRLGAAIFGDDDRFIAPRLHEEELKHTASIPAQMQRDVLGDNLDAWRTEIRKHITPKQWINLSFKDRKAFKCAGEGLIALARRFGINENPIDSTLIHLRLGAAIFGDDDPYIKEAIAYHIPRTLKKRGT